jgi:signal transduction histidine kinase
VQYVRRVSRVSSFARSRGFDLLIAIGAIASALELALTHDDLPEPRTSLWFAVPAVATVVLVLLGRRRFPFAAPAAVWLLAAALSFVDGRLVVSTASLSVAGTAASFLLGNVADDVRGRLGLGVVLSGAAIVVYNSPNHTTGDLIFTPIVFAIAWIAGHAVRERAAQAEAGVFRTARLSRLLERLAEQPGARALDEALAEALDDPTLTVAYWLPEERRHVGSDGRAIELPPEGAATVATEIRHRDQRVGALIHGPALRDEPDVLHAVARAAALALENGRLEAELRARLEALRASRARIVTAGDEERRRLGRDLHDGAQQRLISILLGLQLAHERPELSGELVARALDDARAAVEELRELAAGIHPAVLSQRGLDAGLESLATRASVPVELETELPERMPAPVESAAYFTVAEALTNVAKYAQASYARVGAHREDGELVVEVRDDGIGGADASRGSGLRGLGDRVGALGGSIEVESPPGGGTVLRARIPVAG